ncbi:MAG: hypothetical protein PHH08_03030 [Candidatus ainarchaeum sp.]|nr:hypothetical protein [Candidatus ainarchaeum sp.]
MSDVEFRLQIEKLLKEAKRNCLLCYGRARLRPTEKERDIALRNALAMYSLFGEHFNQLRRQDASVEAIRTSQEYKRVCLDAADACKSCEKDVDSINRFLTKIK